MAARPLPTLQPEQWLVNRLKHTSTASPQFEAEWYGVHNALLSHYFPYQQQFLVKPQPKIPEELPQEGNSFSSTDAEASFSADQEPVPFQIATITAIGGLVSSKPKSISIPDFLIVKATEFATHDRPLLVVEVKSAEQQSENQWKIATGQLHDYMDKIAAQARVGTRFNLIGLLICGTRVQVLRLQSGDPIVADRKRDINSRSFWEVLHKIAKENWEY